MAVSVMKDESTDEFDILSTAEFHDNLFIQSPNRSYLRSRRVYGEANSSGMLRNRSLMSRTFSLYFACVLFLSSTFYGFAQSQQMPRPHYPTRQTWSTRS
jgi:hypothetical protein